MSERDSAGDRESKREREEVRDRQKEAKAHPNNNKSEAFANERACLVNISWAYSAEPEWIRKKKRKRSRRETYSMREWTIACSTAIRARARLYVYVFVWVFEYNTRNLNLCCCITFIPQIKFVCLLVRMLSVLLLLWHVVYPFLSSFFLSVSSDGYRYAKFSFAILMHWQFGVDCVLLHSLFFFRVTFKVLWSHSVMLTIYSWVLFTTDLERLLIWCLFDIV